MGGKVKDIPTTTNETKSIAQEGLITTSQVHPSLKNQLIKRMIGHQSMKNHLIKRMMNVMNLLLMTTSLKYPKKKLNNNQFEREKRDPRRKQKKVLTILL